MYFLTSTPKLMMYFLIFNPKLMMYFLAFPKLIIYLLTSGLDSVDLEDELTDAEAAGLKGTASALQ